MRTRNVTSNRTSPRWFEKRLIFIALASTVAMLFSITIGSRQTFASTIYDNLTSVTDDTEPLAQGAPVGDSFSTASSGFLLSDVSLLLSADDPSDVGSILVQLMSDNSTAPGTVLDTIGTIDDSSLSTTLAAYTLTLTSAFSLAPDTRYWIELTADDSSTSNWAFSADRTAQGVAGEYWNDSTGVYPNSEEPFQMRLSGETLSASVPEPSSLDLLLLGLVAMCGSWFGRKRAAFRAP